MTILIAGLLIFTLVHLYPSVFAASRNQLAERIGDGAFRGLFSIVIVVSLVLIAVGWSTSTPVGIYDPPLNWGLLIAVLVLVAFVLFVAAQTPTNIKRYVRHPQMLAVILWSVAHLLANGDSRSIVLFGGLGVWAILEIVFCNRRDGEWQKPELKPRKWDVITVVIGAAAFFTLLYLHPILFGVAASPYLP